MKNVKRYCAMILTGVLLLTGTYGMYVRAAVPFSTDQELSKFMRASVSLGCAIEELGINMDALYNMPKKDASFFDISFDELMDSIEIPQNYALKTRSVSTNDLLNYQGTFEKQMEKVVIPAANRSISRDPSILSKGTTKEDEILYMYMSHYIDGNHGADIYFSEYGYQSWNMADWITNDDRVAFKRFSGGLASTKKIRERLESFKKVEELVGAGVAIGGITESIEDAVTYVGTEIATGLTEEQKEKFDYAQLVATSSKALEGSEKVTEFQDVLWTQVEQEYDYVSDDIKTMMVTLTAILVFVGGYWGLALTFAYFTIRLGMDLYNGINMKALGMTRDSRVANRVSYYMEYEGYW